MIQPGHTILFQGDSITDAGRRREGEHNANGPQALGNGYAFIASCDVLSRFPGGEIKAFNRGTSGNEVTHLIDRWQADCLDLEPDLVSILIGVNDMWRKMDSGKDNTVEQYEQGYAQLLETTRAKLPGSKIVMCEPFVLRCGSVTDEWFPEFDERLGAMRRLAQKHADAVVPFQKMFNDLCEHCVPAYWAADGVHPSLAGHYKMAQLWAETVLGG